MCGFKSCTFSCFQETDVLIIPTEFKKLVTKYVSTPFRLYARSNRSPSNDIRIAYRKLDPVTHLERDVMHRGGLTARQTAPLPRLISHRRKMFCSQLGSYFLRFSLLLSPLLLQPRVFTRNPHWLCTLFQRVFTPFFSPLHFACRAQRPSMVGVNEHQASRPTSRFTTSLHFAQLQIPPSGPRPLQGPAADGGPMILMK